MATRQSETTANSHSLNYILQSGVTRTSNFEAAVLCSFITGNNAKGGILIGLVMLMSVEKVSVDMISHFTNQNRYDNVADAVVAMDSSSACLFFNKSFLQV